MRLSCSSDHECALFVCEWLSDRINSAYIVSVVMMAERLIGLDGLWPDYKRGTVCNSLVL